MATPELRVPDPYRLAAVARLCESADPYRLDDSLFVEAMREAVTWHRDRSPFYRERLARAGFTPEGLRTLADALETPFVLASFFKMHEILSVPREQISVHLTSSGTTGQKSQIFFDDWSISAAQRMVEFIFNAEGWNTPETAVNYLLYTYESGLAAGLGTSFTDHFLTRFAPVHRAFTALRRTGTGGTEFDPFGCIETLRSYEKEGRPVRIFGFPAFLHFTLQRMRELELPPLLLHPESFVFLGGGWKGQASQAIDKRALYREIAIGLGIPDQRIRDGFGAVEHCVPYIECARHEFHVPTWSRVVIRDLRTLAAVGFGERGFLQFVSPYITSVPAISVLMGDLASLHPPEACGCGTPTPFFVVHGRAGTSRNQSCAIAAAQLIKAEVAAR